MHNKTPWWLHAAATRLVASEADPDTRASLYHHVVNCPACKARIQELNPHNPNSRRKRKGRAKVHSRPVAVLRLKLAA